MTQKVHQVGQLFGLVLRSQTHWGPSGATPFFRLSKGPKNQKWQIRLKTMISHDQSIDNGLLSSHKNFQPNWLKNDWVMAKICMPLYGIIGIFRDFLAHISAKYQYFSMRPSLFDLYYQTTYSLHIPSQNFLKCGFHGLKTPKNPQNRPYLCLQFLLNCSH